VLVTLCSFYLFLGWIPRSAIPLFFGRDVAGIETAFRILSEIPYILLTLLSLLLLEKSYKILGKNCFLAHDNRFHYAHELPQYRYFVLRSVLAANL